MPAERQIKSSPAAQAAPYPAKHNTEAEKVHWPPPPVYGPLTYKKWCERERERKRFAPYNNHSSVSAVSYRLPSEYALRMDKIYGEPARREKARQLELKKANNIPLTFAEKMKEMREELTARDKIAYWGDGAWGDEF